mgnify:FL=1
MGSSQHQLEEERRKYEVMESGYKAVRQYLDDGTGFRGSKELQMEVERVGDRGGSET